MTTEAGTALVRTDDGGDTARLVTPSQDPIFAAGFASPTRIAAGGATGATAVSDDAGLNFTPIGGRLSGTYSRVRAGGQSGHGLRAGRQRLAGQDDRRRQDVDARQRRDLGGRHRRRLPDGARGLRAGLVGRAVPHQRRRRDVEDARHRHDGAPVAARRADDVDGHPRRPHRPAPVDRQRRHVLDRQGRTSSKAKLDAVDRAGSALFASGSRDLLRSTDRGKTWKALHKPTVQRASRPASTAGRLPRREERLLPGPGRRAVADRQRAASRGPRCRASGTEKAYGMAFSSKTQGLPGHRSLRRRARAARASCCKTTDSGAHVAPAVRGVHADPGGGDRRPRAAPTTCSAASRASCSPRPAARPARRAR